MGDSSAKTKASRTSTSRSSGHAKSTRSVKILDQRSARTDSPTPKESRISTKRTTGAIAGKIAPMGSPRPKATSTDR